MGIFFGKNGSQSAGSKKGWKSDKAAVKIANRGTEKSDFQLARGRHKKAVAAKKRKETAAKKAAEKRAANIRAARASSARGRGAG